jgi:hypothetical protein
MTDLVFLSDLKPGDKVVCMGPSSNMHTPSVNLSLYQTGRVYPVGTSCYPERDTPDTGSEAGTDRRGTNGCGLFIWRRATQDEIKTSQPIPVFKVGDYVVCINPFSGLQFVVSGKFYKVRSTDTTFSVPTIELEGQKDFRWAANRFRHATPTEVSAYLVTIFKTGDWVVFTDVLSPVPTKIAGIHKDGGWIAISGSNGWFGAHRFRLLTSDEVTAHLANQKADGHNPHGLTISQVGDGWRLLTRAEIEARTHVSNKELRTSSIKMWATDSRINPGHWSKCEVCGNDLGHTYRTQLSPSDLAALIAPKPMRKVSMTSNDYPPIFWVREKGSDSVARLAIRVKYDGQVSTADGHWESPDEMASMYEYSADRKTWHPCYKEVV